MGREATFERSKGVCMVNRWSVEKLLSFHSAIPDFQNGKDTPRDYLERCLAAIEAREHEV